MKSTNKTLANETRETIKDALANDYYIERIKKKFANAGFEVVENSWGLIEAGEGKTTTNFYARKKGTDFSRVREIMDSIKKNGFNLWETHPVPYAKVQWNDGSVTKEPVQVDNRHQKNATDNLKIPNAKIEIQNKDGSPLSELDFKLLGTLANVMHNPSEPASMEDWVSTIRTKHEREPMWSDDALHKDKISAAKGFLLSIGASKDGAVIGKIADMAVAQDYSNPLFKLGEDLPTAKKYEEGVNKNDPKGWVAISITGSTRVYEAFKHIVKSYRKNQMSHILLYVSNLNSTAGRAKNEAKTAINKFIEDVQSEIDFIYPNGIGNAGENKVDNLAIFSAIPQVKDDHEHYWENDKFGIVPIHQY